MPRRSFACILGCGNCNPDSWELFLEVRRTNKRLELECVQCSPHRHLNNSEKMQLFPFWSLETEFPLPVSLAELRLGRDLHRPDAEAPQIAEVYLADAIVQDESGFRDLDPIVGADTTLQCTRTPELLQTIA